MTATTGTSKHRWWKECVVYQVYPSSFKDSNDDGWGDIKGITSKINYLKDLGVDVVWLSPIYKSPQADMGYDIADYKDIDPMYGTLSDVDELIHELHARGMKLMMDLVVNHTSNEHAWFIDSRKAKSSLKRDWYIWKPPKGHTASGEPIPPNNWCQLLGTENSAWTYDDVTEEFYLSLFTPEQPDLNWENPDVRAAVHDAMDFWLSKGCSGFRMDVINHISKVQSFPDVEANMGPDAKYHIGAAYFANGPRMHEYLQELHDKVLSRYDTITVGEMPFVTDVNEIMRSVGSNARELNMIFIFDIVNVDMQPGKTPFTLHPFDASDISRILSEWQLAMTQHDGWNSLFLENHDQPRSVSRYVDDSAEWREKGAKLLALMQSTLAGTLYVYQGEELGMRNVPRSWSPAEEYKDILSQNFWNDSLARYGNGKDPEKLENAREILVKKARDHARTPFQWTVEPNAGFCSEGVKPWMRVNDDYEVVNAEVQLQEGAGEDGMSTFRFWQRAIASRKAHADVFVYGDFEVIGGPKETQHAIFAYSRTGVEGGKWLIVLNFNGAEIHWEVPPACEVKKWVAGNYGREEIEKERKGIILLRPWEGILAARDTAVAGSSQILLVSRFISPSPTVEFYPVPVVSVNISATACGVVDGAVCQIAPLFAPQELVLAEGTRRNRPQPELAETAVEVLLDC